MKIKTEIQAVIWKINVEVGQKVDFEIGKAPSGKDTAVNVSVINN